MNTDELVHQSVKSDSGRYVACGLKIDEVKSSPNCADVTCPKCIKWRQGVIEAVFEPLPQYPIE
jgi:hypothetical protein